MVKVWQIIFELIKIAGKLIIDVDIIDGQIKICITIDPKTLIGSDT
mgnify:CR=1 FL=1